MHGFFKQNWAKTVILLRGSKNSTPSVSPSKLGIFSSLNLEGNWNGKDGANKTQYNGKEWNDDFGLGWNDYGARMYDPAIARWVAVDPLAGKYLRYSPYNYVLDNPLKYIDPAGMLVRYDWEAHSCGERGVYNEETAEGKNKSSFWATMAEISKKDLISTDKRDFGVSVRNSAGKEVGFLSLSVWQPSTSHDARRPNTDRKSDNDLDDWIFAAGKYGANNSEVNISAEFITTEGATILEGNTKQKHYDLNASIGVSSNVGLVGMTKTHTLGIQSFTVSWSVTEQYYGARSSVNVTARQGEVPFDSSKNMFENDILINKERYKIMVWLETD